MSFNLGLEALAENDVCVDGDVLSYEFLDTVMQFQDDTAEAVVISDGIGSLCGAYENLIAICDVLDEHGNSPALEALVGGNFREGFSMEAAKAAKEGLWARFIKWLKTLWAKIKAAFASFFVSSEKMSKALKERAAELRNNDMKEVNIKLPTTEVLKAIVGFIGTVFKDDIANAKEFINQLKKGAGVSVTGGAAPELDKLIAKRTGEFLQSGMNAFLNPSSFEITKETAIAILGLTASVLDSLKVLKNSVDTVATAVTNLSYTADDDKLAQAAGKDVKTNLESSGHSKDVAKAGGKLTETGVKALGSDDFREGIMKGNKAIVDFLNTCTRKAIAFGSLELSAFKVVKTSK